MHVAKSSHAFQATVRARRFSRIPTKKATSANWMSWVGTGRFRAFVRNLRCFYSVKPALQVCECELGESWGARSHSTDARHLRQSAIYTSVTSD